jgi:hypothetical protein
MSSPGQDLNEKCGRKPVATAFLAAGAGIVIVLVLERLFHPLRLLRHPEFVFKECAIAALIGLAALLVLHGVKRPWD